MPRGSAPGERRGGRAKGVPNKVGQDVRQLARKYTSEAIETLAEIMTAGESHQARVMAADKLLDRGYGKPTQPHAGDDSSPPIRQAIEMHIIDHRPKDR